MTPINRLRVANDDSAFGILGDSPKPPGTFKIMITPEAEALLADAQQKKDMLDSVSTQLCLNPPAGEVIYNSN